jgi:hypothetical protein
MINIQKKYISLYETSKGLNYSVFTRKGKKVDLLESHVMDFPADMSFLDKIKDLPQEDCVGIVLTVRPDDYQLFQIKKPMAPKKELDNAILWTVQDKVFLKSDDYIISHFPCEKLKPVEDIFVVAFKKTQLLETIDALKKKFGNVLSLKIPELNTIALLDYEDPHQDKFVVYLDNVIGKDMIYGIKNYALVKTSLSPVMFEKKMTESGILGMIDTVQTLVHQYATRTNFEIHVSPSLENAKDWVHTLDKTFQNKVFLAKKMAGTEKLKNDQLIAVGGGLSYAKERL